MGKGSGLAVFALLIGIGGLGFGVYTYFTFNLTIESMQGNIDAFELRSSVHRTYFDNRTASYTTAAEDSFYEIPDLSILFQVDPGESVYFLFTCRAALMVPSGSNLYMSFQLKIDNVAITLSRTVVGILNPTGTGHSYSVALQYADSSLGAWPHDVVVETSRICGGYIDNCYLLVQTYIP